MSASWRLAVHPLGPVGAQGLAQAVNLAAQLSLLSIVGREGFADLGLGLMSASSVCFLGEIGFGAYFLRETARSPDWLDSWREAVGSRLLVLTVAFAMAWAALGWAAPQPDTARLVLLSAVPGILASGANPLPALFGLGKVRVASAGILMRFLMQGGGGVAAVLLWPDAAALGIGAAFSAGLLLQVMLGQAAGLPRMTMFPRLPRSLPPPAALRLWGLSLVGTINDRALPFIIGHTRPDILAVALILIQVLQSLAGLGGQMDRLLIPAAATRKGGDPAATLRALLPPLAGAIVVMVVAIPALAWWFHPGLHWAALLLALEWAVVLVGALAFALAFARDGEKRVARFMLVAVPLSTAAQVVVGGHVGLEAVLALRVAVAAIATWLALLSLGNLKGHTPCPAD